MGLAYTVLDATCLVGCNLLTWAPTQISAGFLTPRLQTWLLLRFCEP